MKRLKRLYGNQATMDLSRNPGKIPVFTALPVKEQCNIEIPNGSACSNGWPDPNTLGCCES